MTFESGEDGSAVKSTDCSSRRAPTWWLTATVIPVPGGLRPSPGLHRHCMHTYRLTQVGAVISERAVFKKTGYGGRLTLNLLLYY